MSKNIKNKKIAKILLAVSASLLVLVMVIVFLLSNFLVSFALDSESSFNMTSMMSRALESNGQEGGTQEYSGFGGSEETVAWFNKSADDVYITSEDGLRLHSYNIENEKGNGNYVIVFHGYTSQAKHMAYSAEKFYEMGFNILLPDARSHGESEGRYIGMGWPERKDSLLWINKLVKENPGVKIVLYGISMGGATVMYTVGEALPENVVLAIEDCGYSSVWEEFEGQMKGLFHLPSFPLLDMAAVITEKRAGYDLREASCVEQVRKSRIPILFIHGSEDAFVPFEMLDKVYNAAECEKEKLVIEGAGHAMSASVNPDLYWSTVKSFMGKHIDK